MKIPLEVTEYPKGVIRIILNVNINFFRLGIKPVRFIVDTGSHKTFLGITDVAKFGLQCYHDNIESTYHGRTELKLSSVKINNFYLKTDENKLVTSIDISAIRAMDPNLNKQCGGMINILGLDFIRANGFNFHYLSSMNEAYLEK